MGRLLTMLSLTRFHGNCINAMMCVCVQLALHLSPTWLVAFNVSFVNKISNNVIQFQETTYHLVPMFLTSSSTQRALNPDYVLIMAILYNRLALLLVSQTQTTIMMQTSYNEDASWHSMSYCHWRTEEQVMAAFMSPVVSYLRHLVNDVLQ